MQTSDIRDKASKEQRNGLVASWIFVLIWCACTFAGFYIFAFQARSVFGGAITGLMALLGVYMLWHTIRETLASQKFGVVSLTPRQGLPPRPGGKLTAQLKFHDKAPEATEIEAELRCQYVTWSRGSRGKTDVSEEKVWTNSKVFSLRNTGMAASADISFDIPADARPTDLPGERPSEPVSSKRYPAAGELMHFYRWEVAIVAKVRGLDLERSFPVVIDPALANADAAATAIATAPASPEATPQKNIGQRIGRLASVVFVIGFMATFFFPGYLFQSGPINRSSTTAVAPLPAEPQPTLPPQTPWKTDTSAWSMPLPTFASYLGIAANGIHSTRSDTEERFTFDEIVIEKNPARAEVQYFELRFSVTYHTAESGDTGTAGGLDTRVEDIRGTLTAENPVLVLRNISVVARIPKGAIIKTRYHLASNATARPRFVHEKSREITSR